MQVQGLGLWHPRDENRRFQGCHSLCQLFAPCEGCSYALAAASSSPSPVVTLSSVAGLTAPWFAHTTLYSAPYAQINRKCVSWPAPHSHHTLFVDPTMLTKSKVRKAVALQSS
jgi:hypothetical protein